MEFFEFNGAYTFYLLVNIPFFLRLLHLKWTIYVPRRVGRVS